MQRVNASAQAGMHSLADSAVVLAPRTPLKIMLQSLLKKAVHLTQKSQDIMHTTP